MKHSLIQVRYYGQINIFSHSLQMQHEYCDLYVMMLIEVKVES